jgi:hypothetical protein
MKDLTFLAPKTTVEQTTMRNQHLPSSYLPSRQRSSVVGETESAGSGRPKEDEEIV